jgi:hypothetical protein
MLDKAKPKSRALTMMVDDLERAQEIVKPYREAIGDGDYDFAYDRCGSVLIMTDGGGQNIVEGCCRYAKDAEATAKLIRALLAWANDLSSN